MASPETYTIFHNPKCSKSREAKAMLEHHGVPFLVVHYLEDPLSTDDLRDVMRKLGIADPRAMMRTGEPLYRELGCEQMDRGALLRAMVEHRILIERPIVTRSERAVIGRPTERVEELIES